MSILHFLGGENKNKLPPQPPTNQPSPTTASSPSNSPSYTSEASRCFSFSALRAAATAFGTCNYNTKNSKHGLSCAPQSFSLSHHYHSLKTPPAPGSSETPPVASKPTKVSRSTGGSFARNAAMMLVAKLDLMTTHGSGWKNGYYMVRTLASRPWFSVTNRVILWP